MPRRALPIAIFAGLLVILAVGLTRDPRLVPSPLVGKALPVFNLPAVLDPATQVSAGQLRGRISLLNVWASWCIACAQEHEFLMALAADGAVPLYGLNWKDERDAAGRWLAGRGDPYVASAFDGEGRVGIDLGVYGAPETFLIDAEGVVRHKHVGPLDAVVWERDFVPLISSLGAGRP